MWTNFCVFLTDVVGLMSFVVGVDILKPELVLLAKNKSRCGSCDSRIGFGTEGYPDASNTCGNEAVINPDNGDKHLKAMEYILVQ